MEPEKGFPSRRRSMITSTANAKVKRLAGLQKKKRLREEEGIFLAEGLRMFREVPKDRLCEVYVSEAFYKKEKTALENVLEGTGIRPEFLSDHVYEHVSDTKTPQGVLCVIKRREGRLDEMLGDRCPFLLVLDNLQDPGNVGTILRTAEGAGVTGVILGRDSADIYNPKTIRSTMGSVYRVPFCYAEDIPGVLDRINGAGITTFAAHLEGKLDYDKPDYRRPCAFLIGNEGNGLRDETAEKAEEYIRIPMLGQVESLNAAIAASVLMFEAARQRRR